MAQIFSPQRLSEFQALYAKHYGIQLSLEEAEEHFAALVDLLRICTGTGGAAGGTGRDSNPAPVTNDKNLNE